jgi:plastocyanin
MGHSADARGTLSGRWKPTLAAIAVATITVAAGTSGAIAITGARVAGTHVVTLKNLRFHPATLNIDRGESVRWVWADGGTEHNVTFHGFHSRTQATGSYTVEFAKRGTFSYDCTIHVSEGMKGRVIVH